MKNHYFHSGTKNKVSLLKFFVLTLFLNFIFTESLYSQICGTPGVDGPANITSSVNTYYPTLPNDPNLNTGAQAIRLGSVPSTDASGNSFGTTAIAAGDLLLIIQMQDAEINFTNTTSYGSGSITSVDGLGGSGYTNIGNTGIYEYVIATNSVPLTGGNLTFKGAGPTGGIINSFFNAAATTTRGKRTFQIIRVPQYSNLTLTTNITAPPFNGTSGGVIAFNVSGTFNFNGRTIDGNARGFRGGYSPRANSGANNSTNYVGLASDTSISGKGEGIAGTPRYMWDGYNQVDNGVEGMPGGSAGRGAPGNAGGGGNDHNAGGGGGGNGGYGGLGGKGWQGGTGDVSPLTGGGRPGFTSYTGTVAPLNRLVMGGGGGAGDANNATTGVKGGVGGAIIIINAGTTTGTGSILANGGNGASGAFGGSPDGAGGGAAGGSVFLNVTNSSTASITIQARGGNGGNTENDGTNQHGPGGGGGGGIIKYNVTGGTVSTNVNPGLAGLTNNGGTGAINHGAVNGGTGNSSTFITSDLPQYTQINSNCFPSLQTSVQSITKSVCNTVNNEIVYSIEIRNTGSGSAAGVLLDFVLPTGINFVSASASYSVGASGPSGALTNTGTSSNPLLGSFTIALDATVTITLRGIVTSSTTNGINNVVAQALYRDPTRTSANPNRNITAFTNSYGTANKTYEGFNQANVNGTNFNGVLSNVTVDDVTILSLPVAPNATVTQPTCSSPLGSITVSSPPNGTGTSYSLTGINPASATITNSTGVFSNLASGTYQLTTTNSNNCTSTSSPFTVDALAGAPSTTGVSICIGGSGSLTAAGCNGSTVPNWYTQPSGGTPIFSGSSFNPVGVTGSGLANTNTAGTTVFYVSCGNSPCRTSTSFIINPTPSITNTTPGSNCGPGTVTLSASASSGVLNWFSAASGGTAIATGNSFTTPNISVSTQYFVNVTSNGCTSSRTAVLATINTIPTITSTTPGSRCGSGTVPLQATASAGTINWYANAQGGTLLASGTTFTTPIINATTTYYVEAIANGCASSSRIAVAAVVNEVSTLVLTSGTQNQSICNGSAISSTQYTYGGSATTVTVTNLPLGLSSNINTTNKTVTISGTPTASGTYTITTSGHSSPCNATIINGIITFSPQNTTAAGTSQTVCINTLVTNITHATTGATGISNAGVSGANGLPAGVSAAWASNTITISGTPTASGTFNYSIPLTGGCGTVNATGRIIVTPANTAGTASSTPTLCINTLVTNITHATTGATGISDSGVSGANGLPAGVAAAWASNTITISGTPTASGTFNYSIPLTGGCGTVNATGTITVTPANTAATASSTPTLCINTLVTNITHATTGATGISNSGVSGANGLPAGVAAAWASNTITISGTPTASGTFNYSIPLTGGCGTVNATGTITVTPANTAGTASSTPTLCINTLVTNITHATTGATGISNSGVSGANGLPAGVAAAW
ncbi:beta strand repeat-containing protein, partial [Flavobacterium sp. T-16]|uniref:beta strand repeat-containing protein n=1 Tax=Flavobacterium sp. T-16 TaxID=2893173 RepID=UPI00386018AA